MLGEAIVMGRSGIGREKRMMRERRDAIAGAGNRVDADADGILLQSTGGAWLLIEPFIPLGQAIKPTLASWT